MCDSPHLTPQKGPHPTSPHITLPQQPTSTQPLPTSPRITPHQHPPPSHFISYHIISSHLMWSKKCEVRNVRLKCEHNVSIFSTCKQWMPKYKKFEEEKTLSTDLSYMYINENDHCCRQAVKHYSFYHLYINEYIKNINDTTFFFITAASFTCGILIVPWNCTATSKR